MLRASRGLDGGVPGAILAGIGINMAKEESLISAEVRE
jgi:hypothetical protein